MGELYRKDEMKMELRDCVISLLNLLFHKSLEKRTSSLERQHCWNTRRIQRRLHEFGIQLNLFEGPIFNHPQHGLVTIIDNRFVQYQVNGMYQSHPMF